MFKNKSTKFIIFEIIIMMIGVIGITLAVSYAMNSVNINVDTANLAIDYTGNLTLPSVNLVPILDSEVESNTENVMRINFSVKGASTNPNIPIIYDVILSDLVVDTALKSEYVKWELEKNGTVISSGSLDPWFDSIRDGKFWLTEIQQDLVRSSGTADNYEFRLWISEACTGDITTCTEDMDQSNMLNKSISGKIEVVLYTKGKEALERKPIESLAEGTLINLGLSVSEGRPNFSRIAQASCEYFGPEYCETTNGIYMAEDDLGTSYYFRGAVENNYVKFAGYYWRIIRINGDGTIRMIYDGTTAHSNGESSTDRQLQDVEFNTNYDDNAYVGYMYGTPGSSTYEETHANINDSTIKTANDAWYKTNIQDKGYGDYVADAIYCSDRQVTSFSETGLTGNGIGNQETAYGFTGRYSFPEEGLPNFTPTLKCAQANDRFTTSTSLGNGDLTYPVGLLTADEVNMAGGIYGFYNNSYYLFNGNEYWLFSPYGFDGAANVWNVIQGSGMVMIPVTYSSYGLRPVISLKSNIGFSGNGTMNNPFEIN